MFRIKYKWIIKRQTKHIKKRKGWGAIIPIVDKNRQNV